MSSLTLHFDIPGPICKCAKDNSTLEYCNDYENKRFFLRCKMCSAYLTFPFGKLEAKITTSPHVSAKKPVEKSQTKPEVIDNLIKIDFSKGKTKA
jgi:hypothetical protein